MTIQRSASLATLPAKASLFGLPQELRDEIWHYTFNDGNQANLASLLVCRDFYHDAGQIAFRSTIFRVSSTMWEAANLLAKETIFSAPLSPERRAMINAITIPTELIATFPKRTPRLDPTIIVNFLDANQIHPITLNVQFMQTIETRDTIWSPPYMLQEDRHQYLRTISVTLQSATCLFRMLRVVLRDATYHMMTLVMNVTALNEGGTVEHGLAYNHRLALTFRRRCVSTAHPFSIDFTFLKVTDDFDPTRRTHYLFNDIIKLLKRIIAG